MESRDPLAARLDRLQEELAAEKHRNRRLARVVMALGVSQLAIIAVGAAAMQEPPNVVGKTILVDELAMKKFILHDADRKPRATLEMQDDQPSLALFDQDGQARLWLSLNPGGRPFLEFQDKAEKRQMFLGVDPDGHPYQFFNDEHETKRLSLGFAENGRDAGLTIFDKQGHIRSSLGSTGEGLSGFNLIGRDGLPRCQIGIGKDDTAIVDLPEH